MCTWRMRSVAWLLPLLPLLVLCGQDPTPAPDDVQLLVDEDTRSIDLDRETSTVRVVEGTASVTPVTSPTPPTEPVTTTTPPPPTTTPAPPPPPPATDPPAGKVPRSLPQSSECAPGASCAPLSYCRTILDLLDRTCLSGEKLQSISCGYRDGETMVCCPPGGFSPIYTTTTPPPPPTTAKPPPPKCGTPQVFNWRTGYNGLGAQPWVARVGFKNVETGTMDFPCCASIISEQVVLTAAHCALAKATGHKLSSVRIGEYDSTTDPDCTSSFCALAVQDIGIDHVVVHPGYERATFSHDVALLVLKSRMTFSVGVQPICIDGSVAPAVGTNARLVGWGITAGQTAVPPVQQQLQLPIVPLDVCAQVYSRVVPVTSDQVCVGGEEGRDACSGFGGAPLIVLDSSSSRYYQLAIVSFGANKCGSAGVPSVYTRIDHYADWIRANMV